jgi:hypothetical protein
MTLKDLAKAVNSSALPAGSKRHAKLSFDQNKITLSIGKDTSKDDAGKRPTASSKGSKAGGVPEIVIMARTSDNETSKNSEDVKYTNPRSTSRSASGRKVQGPEYSIAEYIIPEGKRGLTKDKAKEKQVKENNYNFYLSQLLSSQEYQGSGETKTQKQFAKWKRQWQLLHQKPKSSVTSNSCQSLSLKSLDGGGQPQLPPPSKRRVDKVIGSEEFEDSYSRRRHRKRPKQLEVSVEDDLEEELELVTPKRRRKHGRRRSKSKRKDIEDYEDDYEEEEDEVVVQSEEEPEEQVIELAPPMPKADREGLEARARTKEAAAVETTTE